METKNLVIRPTQFDDCNYFARWEGSQEVIEYLSIEPGITYEEVVTHFIRDNLDPTKLQFTIVKKDGEEPIGRIYVTKLNKTIDSLDITRIYIGSLENRKKGYGEEALRAFLEYAFINLHMERVTLDYFVKNRPAQSLYEKIGFTKEGVLRHGTKKGGKYFDLQQLSMLRAEYYDEKI